MSEQEEQQFAESFLRNMQFLADKAQKVQVNEVWNIKQFGFLLCLFISVDVSYIF